MTPKKNRRGENELRPKEYVPPGPVVITKNRKPTPLPQKLDVPLSSKPCTRCGGMGTEPK